MTFEMNNYEAPVLLLQKYLANYTVPLITSYWLMGNIVWLLRWIIMRHLYYYFKNTLLIIRCLLSLHTGLWEIQYDFWDE